MIYMKADWLRGVYFNPAVGSGTASAQPVCRSMPAEVPDLGGICPERYSKRRRRGAGAWLLAGLKIDIQIYLKKYIMYITRYLILLL